MFCEKCGTKNEKEAKFCASCGHKLTEIQKDEKNKVSSKNKLIMGSILLISLVAIVVLGILLNNPVKKVEDGLEKYYRNYNNDNNKELIQIGKVLKSNKENKKVLKNIKDTTHKIMDKWVKNFNTEYKDKETLVNSYNKVLGALKDIYSYYNGLEYMLDKDLYNNYYEELQKLNRSKHSYLTGKEYVDKNSEKELYLAYYNYQKVIEEDSYYKEASKFVNEYVKDEINKLKEKSQEYIKINDNSTNEDIYNCYVEQLKYLKDNKTSNNIDLSSTEDYKKLYETASRKIVEYTKKIGEEKEKNYDVNSAIEFIKTTMNLFNGNEDIYKELNELLKEYQDKMPDKLTDKDYTSKTSSASFSKWKREIDGKEYGHYLSFAFEGENQSITYNLNNEYKKFTTKIVRGSDWDDDFTGYFVITSEGKELYKSAEITKTSDVNADIEIDVSGINELKIEFVTKSKTEGFNRFYIYLVEPYLYK